MITISLCMIVKNEADTLPRCLDSIRDLVEEIVIVDTGSSDNTIDAAARYTDRIFRFSWCDDFSKARNFAFDQATMEYCMWLDADDVLEPEDQRRFLQLKETLPPDTDMVMLPYHTAFDTDGRPTFTYERERLVRRSFGFRWEGAIHEAIPPAGVIRHGDAAVTHRKTGPGDPDRNLRIFDSLRRKRPLTPREQFYYARELTYHGQDEAAAQELQAFLAAGNGWVENILEACRDLAACYRRLGRNSDAFSALTTALRYGPPRAELCCDLGQYFFDTGAYSTAIYWYEQALQRPRSDHTGGFTIPDCHDYIPLLQLCVCWYHLGDIRRAEGLNEAAATVKPHSETCRRNRAFFAQLRTESSDN